jgi:DNA-binding CsgD family transcriptional regulator
MGSGRGPGRPPGTGRFTPDQIRELREAAQAGEKIIDLAARYGIRPSTTSLIVHGKLYADAPGPIKHGRHHGKDYRRMTDKQIVVARLRAEKGETASQIAADMGVKPWTVAACIKGRVAGHLPGPTRKRTRDYRRKLTDEDVEDMRHMYVIDGVSSVELAEIFGVSKGTVNMITHGHKRKDAPGPIAPPRTRSKK